MTINFNWQGEVTKEDLSILSRIMGALYAHTLKESDTTQPQQDTQPEQPQPPTQPQMPPLTQQQPEQPQSQPLTQPQMQQFAQPSAPTPPSAIPTVPTTPTTPTMPTTPTTPTMPTTAQTYTLEQLMVAGGLFAEKYGLVAGQELLQMFGVSQLSQLPPEQYGTFAMTLRQRGINL